MWAKNSRTEVVKTEQVALSRAQHCNLSRQDLETIALFPFLKNTIQKYMYVIFIVLRTVYRPVQVLTK